MKIMLDAFWRALAYCLHPRVVLLSLLPLLLMVDSLEPGDANRIEVEAMAAAVARALEDARARTQQAAARLGG